MVQWFTDLFNKFGNWLIQVLPSSPFQGFISSFHGKFDDGLGWLNWFISFSDLRLIFSVWLGAVAIFYLYRIIMKWVGML